MLFSDGRAPSNLSTQAAALRFRSFLPLDEPLLRPLASRRQVETNLTIRLEPLLPGLLGSSANVSWRTFQQHDRVSDGSVIRAHAFGSFGLDPDAIG